MIMKIEEEIWYEELIWCPSQCYYYFKNPLTRKLYCIYLRWRYNDPWTAELIECDEDYEFIDELDWEILDVGFFHDDEYKELEDAVINLVQERLPLNYTLRKGKVKE